MSADKHTAEPWRLFNLLEGAYEVCKADDYATGGVCAPHSRADARRIVACVNALAGVGTEVLEEAAKLAPLHRFGTLRDLLTLHHVKAKDCA